jgi:hypothetical protein
MVIYAAEGYSGSEDGREARIGLEIEVVRRGLRPAGAVGMTRLAGLNLKPADARRLSSGGAYVAPERGRGGGHMDRRSSWDWVIEIRDEQLERTPWHRRDSEPIRCPPAGRVGGGHLPAVKLCLAAEFDLDIVLREPKD